MGIRVDVEDSAGARKGPGPLRGVRNWQVIRRLSRAGEISFEPPARSSRVALLRSDSNPQPVVRAWKVVAGVLTERGAGIVHKLGLNVVPGQEPRLSASGPDILHELTKRTVAELVLSADGWQRPYALYSLIGSTDDDLTLAYDGDMATHEDLELHADRYVYVGSPLQLSRLAWYLGTYNANSQTMKGQYFKTGAGWSDLVDYVDGTEVGGKTLAQDEEMTWTPQTDEEPVLHAGMTLNWYRFHPTGTLTSVEIEEIQVYGAGPTTADLSAIIALAPSGWSLDAVYGYGSTAMGTYAEFAHETVLAALVKVGDKKREHFVLTPGARKVRWLRGVPEFEFSLSAYSGTWQLGEQVTGATSGAQGTCQWEDSGSGKFRAALTTTEPFEVGEVVTGEWSAATGTIDVITNNSDCGVRAVAPRGYSHALIDNAKICLIKSLEEIVDSSDARITRIYPFGAGNGDVRATLAKCTRTAPTGFTLSTANNYIATSAETATTRIDRVRVWPDIGNLAGGIADESAANALFDAALAYLKWHLLPYYSYRLEVEKLNTIVLPGQTIRVIYSGWCNDYHWVDIDRDLIILETTETIDQTGQVRTVALQVATLDRWPESDADAVAQLLENGSVYQNHRQSSGYAAIAGLTRSTG